MSQVRQWMGVTRVDAARRDSASSLPSNETEERPPAQLTSLHTEGREALLELRTAHQTQQQRRKGRTVRRWIEHTAMTPPVDWPDSRAFGEASESDEAEDTCL